MKKIGTGLRFFIFRFLLPMCGFFTLFVVSIALFTEGNTLLRDKIFILLFASAGLALIDTVFYLPKINIYFKVATHFIALMLLLLAVLWMSGYMNAGNWVLVMVGAALIYLILCPIILLLRYGKKKKEKEQKAEDYQPRYKD